MGRINFGRAIKDFKGLTGDVTMRTDVDGDEVTWNLKDWTMRTLPDGYDDALKAIAAKDKGAKQEQLIDSRAGYYRGYFNLKKTGDTFINMETWGKGASLHQRPCHRPLLEHRPATDALRARMLAEKRQERDCRPRRCRPETNQSMGPR